MGREGEVERADLEADWPLGERTLGGILAGGMDSSEEGSRVRCAASFFKSSTSARRLAKSDRKLETSAWIGATADWTKVGRELVRDSIMALSSEMSESVRLEAPREAESSMVRMVMDC